MPRVLEIFQRNSQARTDNGDVGRERRRGGGKRGVPGVPGASEYVAEGAWMMLSEEGAPDIHKRFANSGEIAFPPRLTQLFVTFAPLKRVSRKLSSSSTRCSSSRRRLASRRVASLSGTRGYNAFIAV